MAESTGARNVQDDPGHLQSQEAREHSKRQKQTKYTLMGAYKRPTGVYQMAKGGTIRSTKLDYKLQNKH